MNWRSLIRTAWRIVAAIAWCLSLVLLATFLFFAARAAIWPVVDKIFADTARAVSKEQVHAVKAFTALIAAAYAVRFTVRLVNRRDDPDRVRLPVDDPDDQPDLD